MVGFINKLIILDLYEHIVQVGDDVFEWGNYKIINLNVSIFIRIYINTTYRIQLKYLILINMMSI